MKQEGSWTLVSDNQNSVSQFYLKNQVNSGSSPAEQSWGIYIEENAGGVWLSKCSDLKDSHQTSLKGDWPQHGNTLRTHQTAQNHIWNEQRTPPPLLTEGCKSASAYRGLLSCGCFCCDVLGFFSNEGRSCKLFLSTLMTFQVVFQTLAE